MRPPFARGCIIFLVCVSEYLLTSCSAGEVKWYSGVTCGSIL